jgi:hypothetical protein
MPSRAIGLLLWRLLARLLTEISASSFVSNLATDREAGLILEIDIGERLAVI